MATIGTIFLLSVLFAIHFQGTAVMREAMFHDWQALIPDFTTQGGMRFIGKDLSSHATPFPWLQTYSLRLSYIMAWLLALLPLGVKNIHLGPTLPAFLSPRVAQPLVDTFGIAGIGTVEEDLACFFGA